ncbi:hypothetical protein [Almyronema epifaneia]|uniref:Uncharacterized protein n=1 Tax=Almyronema epifaneia S1 TaxID=2991925 RepID=A0ABW6ICW8_9CYAN
MSSAASQFPEYSQPADPNANEESAKTPLTRPTLLRPPKRRPSSQPADAAEETPATPPPSEAVPPAATNATPPSSPQSATPAASEPTAAAAAVSSKSELPRQQPISPPSEPMQYRAIGLVKGCYVPSEEQFNRGQLQAADGTEIDTVLLGRVTSLVKNHLDLEKPHLWVVYPRTRKLNFRSPNSEVMLHLQIVGVWEPETLKTETETETEAAAETETKTAVDVEAAAVTEIEATEPDADESVPAVAAAAKENDDATRETAAPGESSASSEEEEYFSIRGEVLKYDDRNGEITINIVQGLKHPERSTKDFRLTLQGELSGRIVGYFWDLKVKRQGSDLVVDTASSVGVVPPKKRKKGETKEIGRNRRGGNFDRPRSPHSSVPKPQKPTTRRAKSEEKSEDS